MSKRLSDFPGVIPQEILRFLPSLSDGNSIQEFIEDQFEIDGVIERNRKKKPPDPDTDSDEEFKFEIRNALKKYKSNIKAAEPGASKRPPPAEEINGKNNFNAPKGNSPKGGISSAQNGRKDSGDPAADIVELIRCLFGTRKNQTPMSYTDYAKQGAIPKRMMKTKPGSSDLQAILREVELSTSKQNCHNETENIGEDTYNRPFYYVVPENPCPNFSLPRGSYYVIPGTPDSSTYDKIVFHPERETQNSKKKNKKKSSSEMHPSQDPSEMNNLGKDALLKMDSHLNIGPLDVKLSESTDNLETNYGSNKIYCKTIMPARDCENASAGPEGERDDEPEVATVENEAAAREEKLQDAVLRLSAVFPDMLVPAIESLAEEYVNSEFGLELLIAEKHFERKIQAQLNRLVLAFPHRNPQELEEKCYEFEGNETLVDAYIARVQQENKIAQRVVDLQYIFPDADTEFLRKNVERLNDDDGALSLFTTELLESKNYPKVSEQPLSAERKMLWEKYVKNFSVRSYIRDVPNPEDFDGRVMENRAERSLVSKYLQAKYPLRSADSLEKLFASQNCSLSATCETLDLTEGPAAWESSMENEDFDENFLKKICYVEHKTEIDEYLKEAKERKEMEVEEARVNGWFLSCPLCSDDELVASEVVTCPEGHVFCVECIKKYVEVKTGDGVYKFVCPLEKCETFFTLRALEDLLPGRLLSNIIKKQQAEEINTAEVEGLESCLYCEFAYIPNPQDKIFKCQNPACLAEICRKCHEKNHIPLRCEEVERPMDVEARKRIEETMTENLIRVCPKCGKKIVKIDGCNKISCSCGALFCYICRQNIRDYSHFGRNPEQTGLCPLYSNNEELHHRAVTQAGIRARDEILRENPNVRILYDPSNE